MSKILEKIKNKNPNRDHKDGATHTLSPISDDKYCEPSSKSVTF